jgi:hypothetical protein
MRLFHNQNIIRRLLDQDLGQRAGVLVVVVLVMLRIVRTKLDQAGCSNPSSVFPGLTDPKTQTGTTTTMELEIIIII